jgi:hypothetical protein
MSALNNNDFSLLLQEFPTNIKLSYENIIHKKVYNADINLAIPCGPKFYAWFYSFNNKNVCFLLELGPDNQIKNMRICNACFSSELSYGTILYGTLLQLYNREYFIIEDIHSYKNKTVGRENWENKFTIIHKLLSSELKKVEYSSIFITFTMPLLSGQGKLNKLIEMTNKANYTIESVRFLSFNRAGNYLFIPYEEFSSTQVSQQYQKNIYKPISEVNNSKIINKYSNHNKTYYPSNSYYKNENSITQYREKIFTVKPDVTNDIYHLFITNEHNGVETLVDVAYIPNLSTSVMMNSLFRNIKENINLDALEESDDDEEFESDAVDKFVYLDKSLKMVCSLHPKFKKWVPVKVV